MVPVFTIFLVLLFTQDPLVCKMEYDFLGHFQDKLILGTQKYSSLFAIKQIKLKVACLLLYSIF
jgi:hypothetical protein